MVLVASLVLSACSLNPNPTEMGSVAEPRSTDDVSVYGGASLRAISSAELAELADILVRVDVLDVMPSVANTLDGRFPRQAEMDAPSSGGLHQLAGLVVYTPVRVRVAEVLASKALGPVPGEEITILVAGGTVETVLTPDEARYLGVAVVEKSVDSAGRITERMVSPHEPVEFAWGHAPSESLTEGDSLVLALQTRSDLLFRGGQTPEAFHTIDPAGVYRNTPDGWLADRALSDGAISPDQFAARMASER